MTSPRRLLIERWRGLQAAVLLPLLTALGMSLAAVSVAAQPAIGAAPQQSQAAGTATAPGGLDALRGWLGGSKSQPELLPPEQAFTLEVQARDASTIQATLTPAPDYYLYRDRIQFTVRQPQDIAVAKVTLPPGESKADPNFGTVEVYHRPVQALITLGGSTARPASLELLATYQGCNDPVGVCYPPVEQVLTIALPAGGSTFNTPAGVAASTDRPAVAADDEAAIRQLFTGGSRWALVLAFFGFGILLAFTPCMLPMIPILSGIIVGQGSTVTRRHALGLSALYVLGMAITYAIAGVAAGLAGALLSAWLQNPWVLGSFAAIFVLLSLSMFGVYELQLPGALQTRLASAGSRIPGGKATGAFLIGVLSAVIVGPCVAAPLAGALLYISQSRDVVLGGTALFAMALGMGVPLMLVGATAGTLLPRAGPWMESVKRVFGVTLLAVAVWLVTPVIPLPVQQLLWAALLIVPAVFLHALDPLPPGAPGYRRLFKGFGVIALLTGAALLVGALSGGRDILQPLAGLRAGSLTTTARAELPFVTVRSVAELEQRIRTSGGRPVMLDFWAEWCVSCKEMEHFTFSDPRVQARLRDTLVLRADVTANNADDRALLARFSLFGPPGIVFFDGQGREVSTRVIGYQSADRFLKSLDRTGAVGTAGAGVAARKV